MFVVRPPGGSDPAPVVARAVSRTRRCWSALLGATLLLAPVPAFPAAAAQGAEAPWKVREATGPGNQASAGGPSAAAAGVQPPSSVPPPGAARQTGYKAAQRAALPLECSGSTIYALQNGASASDPGTLLALDAASLAGPALALVKTATPAVVTGAGQRVDYRFTLTDTGNTTLTDVTVTEPVFTGTGPAPLVACPEGALAPGQSRTCTAAYTVTQADVGAGALTNAALATGTPPTGPLVTATADRTVIATFSRTAYLTVVKTADPTRVRKPGAEVEYSFVVTNTGSAVLQDITVDEVRFTGSGTRPAVSCPRGPSRRASG